MGHSADRCVDRIGAALRVPTVTGDDDAVTFDMRVGKQALPLPSPLLQSSHADDVSGALSRDSGADSRSMKSNKIYPPDFYGVR